MKIELILIVKKVQIFISKNNLFYLIVACGKNPCKNNGTCSITADRRIKCTCPLRYKGSFCETKF